MSSEIPNLEKGYNDSVMYDRIVEILKYQQEYPESDWRKEEEDLIFIEINGAQQVIKDFFITELEETEKLKIFVSFLRLGTFDSASFEISDPNKIRELKSLRSPKGIITTNGYIAPNPEKVAEILRDLEEWKRKQRKK